MSADGRIEIDTRVNDEGLDDDLKGLQKRMEGVGKSMTDTGKSLSKSVTAPLVGAGAASVKFAIDQETAFAQVTTLLTGSSADFEKYKGDIRKNSSEMGVAFDEYAEAVYGSISAGVDQGEAVEFAGKMAKLAKGGFTDMGTATDVVTTALNAYGLETSEAGRVSDMLINTQNLGKTTVDQLASSMGAVIPTAQAQGVSLEQLSTGYAILTKNGIATSEAGTYMKAMFGELGKSGSKTDKILREKTGKSFKELSEEGMNTAEILGILEGEAKESGLSMADLFGSAEAGNAALTIMKDGGEDFTKTLGSMGDVAGVTEDAFGKMNETTGAKMQKAWVQLQNAAAGLGDILLPIIVQIAEAVMVWAEKFAGLSPHMQKVILIVGAVAAAIGPLLIVIGSVIGAVAKMVPIFKKVWGVLKKLKTAFTVIRTALLFLTGPVGIVIGIITALAIIIYKNWDAIKEKTAAIFSWLGEFLPVIWEGIKVGTGLFLEFLKNLFMTGLTFIVDVFKVILGGIVAAAKFIWDGVVLIVTTYINIVKAIITAVLTAIVFVFTSIWNGLVAAAQFIWAGIVLVVTTGINLVKTVITTVLNAIVFIFTSFWNGLVFIVQTTITVIQTVITTVFNVIKTVITTILTAIQTAFTFAWNAIKTAITAAVNFIRTTVVNGFNIIKNFIVNTATAIYSKLLSVWNTIRSAISNAVNAIRSAVSNAFAKMKSAISSAMDTIRNVVKGAFDKVLSFVTGLGTSFYNAGKGLIEQIIKGIKAMIGKVTGTVEDVANKIRDFLPFSPAKEGPLSDLDHLDFGGPIQDSLKNALPKVRATMQHLLQVPQINAPAPAFGSIGAGTPAAARTTRHGDTVNHYNIQTQPGQEIDHRKLSQELYKLQARDKKGAGRK